MFAVEEDDLLESDVAVESSPVKQYAFCPCLSAEMAIADVLDSAQSAALQGESCAVVGTDIEGAYDAVPHKVVVERLLTLGVHPNYVQFIWKFLQGRRLVTRIGQAESVPQAVKTGLAQGGILSPWIWNQVIRSVSPQVAGVLFVWFADDGTMVIRGATPEEVAARAEEAVEGLTLALAALGLRLSPSKMVGMWFKPPEGGRGYFRWRRDSGGRAPRPRPADPSPTDSGVGATGLSMDSSSSGRLEGESIPELPVKEEDCVRILGVFVDQEMLFTRHLEICTQRALKRVALLRCLAKKSWGLEVNTLSHTTICLVQHLCAYGIGVIAPYAAPYVLRRLNTVVLNPAARIVLRSSSTMRLEALRVLSGLKSAFNLAAQRAAVMVASVCKGPPSQLRDRLVVGIQPIASSFEVSWSQQGDRVLSDTGGKFGSVVTGAVGSGGVRFFCADEDRVHDVVPSAGVDTFHSYAPELRGVRSGPKGEKCFFDMARSLLHAIGWHESEVQQMIRWSPSELLSGISIDLENSCPNVAVTTGLTRGTVLSTDGGHDRKTGVGAGAAIMGRGHDSWSCGNVWAGRCDSSYSAEWLALEKGLEALLAEFYRGLDGQNSVIGGDEQSATLWGRRLLIVTDCDSLAMRIQSLLAPGYIDRAESVLMGLLEQACLAFPDGVQIMSVRSHLGVEWNEAADALCTGAMAAVSGGQVGRMARGMTLESVKTLVKDLLDFREMTTLQELSEVDSVSGGAMTFLEWSRRHSRRLFKDLSDRHVSPGLLQLTASKVLGATRFKELSPLGFAIKVCPLCEENLDSFEHMMSCFEFSDVHELVGSVRRVGDVIERMHDIEYPWNASCPRGGSSRDPVDGGVDQLGT